MADKTAIEWTDATWNPVTGCSIASPGCRHCYAMRLAGTRLKHHPSRRGLTGKGNSGPVWTGQVRFNEKWLIDPLRRRAPKRIFACAHGDLFHPSVPAEWIDLVHAVMAFAPRHDFQVLTKRSARMEAYFTDPGLEERVRAAARDLQQRYPRRRDLRRLPEHPLFPLPNEWLGVSVEDCPRTLRIDHLRRTPAALRFVSFEPLLEYPGPLDLSGISWAIVGGESGPRARRMQVDWVHVILDACFDQDVAFFFKQWGGPRPKSAGRLLDGVLYDTIPERLDDGSYFIPLPTENRNLDAAVRRMEAFLDKCRSDAPIQALAVRSRSRAAALMFDSDDAARQRAARARMDRHTHWRVSHDPDSDRHYITKHRYKPTGAGTASRSHQALCADGRWRASHRVELPSGRTA